MLTKGILVTLIQIYSYKIEDDNNSQEITNRIKSHYSFIKEEKIYFLYIFSYLVFWISVSLVVYMDTDRYCKMEIVLSNTRKDFLIKIVKNSVFIGCGIMEIYAIVDWTIYRNKNYEKNLDIQYWVFTIYMFAFVGYFSILDFFFCFKLIGCVIKSYKSNSVKSAKFSIKQTLVSLLVLTVVTDFSAAILFLFSEKISYTFIGINLGCLHLITSTVILQIVSNANNYIKEAIVDRNMELTTRISSQKKASGVFLSYISADN
ncbi:hypothetical protein HK099_002660 [Clydaea vesicula]|uniref:Uncharacterized protein n=1 Tax=Clydaea vesicula TaxID=447962 RepID=A0AAD5U7F3_9FUNG|nr:hypothetical protein HK099_002660 [Clydaea vesicula]